MSKMNLPKQAKKKSTLNSNNKEANKSWPVSGNRPPYPLLKCIPIYWLTFFVKKNNIKW